MGLRYFNTSNVTVQLSLFFVIGLASNISIHLMLLFNQMEREIFGRELSISIHLMLLFNASIPTDDRAPAKFQYI